MVAAEPVDLALLEDAENPGLGVWRHVPDLVEEQRTAVGKLEAARPRLDPGGRTLLDPEELGLEQVARQGGAVERHEGLAGPRRGGMEVAGEDLLAGAGLAANQHADVAARHPGRIRIDPLHGRRHGRRLGQRRRHGGQRPTDLLARPPSQVDQPRAGLHEGCVAPLLGVTGEPYPDHPRPAEQPDLDRGPAGVEGAAGEQQPLGPGLATDHLDARARHRRQQRGTDPLRHLGGARAVGERSE